MMQCLMVNFVSSGASLGAVLGVHKAQGRLQEHVMDCATLAVLWVCKEGAPGKNEQISMLWRALITHARLGNIANQSCFTMNFYNEGN